jgi:hypothetical protein
MTEIACYNMVVRNICVKCEGIALMQFGKGLYDLKVVSVFFE